MEKEFVGFPKIARLSRQCIVTEKIDGTNAQVFISEDGEILTGSRTRWITVDDDNAGFARWVQENKELLLLLGPGSHFGEWWGQGIGREYGLSEKRFSLFNTRRWCNFGDNPKRIEQADPRVEKYQDVLPEGLTTTPVLYEGIFDTAAIAYALDTLKLNGSVAAPGFMRPEGIVVYHVAGNVCFKQTIEGDGRPKGFVLK